MVRRDVVAVRVARAAAWLDDVERAFAGPVETLLADVKTRDLALFYLFLAIQECIDLAAHWVADEGWSPADDAGSTFDVLAGRGVIDLETAEALRSAAGLRNRIAHGYALLDARRVRDEARQGLPSLRAFLAAAAGAAGL
ncbi:MAG TPA: DUF86 domain-containing protein [Thermoanaerobaculia bacterium]|nr:DUF86 domain-containing protein [Thermoanaerobaculia bacterium]